MRPSGNNVTLLTGITIALLVTFHQPIQQAIRLVLDVEARHGLALLPGLAVLAVVLVSHLVASQIDRVTWRRRADQTSRVIAMGQTLTRASSMSNLRNRLRQDLPEVVGTENVWAVVQIDKRWVALAGGLRRRPHEAGDEIEARANQLRERHPLDGDLPNGVEIDGHFCFPLTVGDHGIGVLGAPKPAVGAEELRHRLASVVAILGISVYNVHLLTEIDERGMLDALTGCFNRTQGIKVLDAELQRAKRVHTDVTLLMLDLDYFKSVNDTHGHLCGDALLTAVGKRLHEELRNSDVKIRYGGEEFMVLLPDTPVAGATHVAEILNRELGKVTVPWEGRDVSTTVSIGVAAAHSGELDLADGSGLSLMRQALIGRADAALYRAKREGRDRVCIDQPALDAPPQSEGHVARMTAIVGAGSVTTSSREPA